MKNEKMLQPWRDEKYNKIRKKFIEKMYNDSYTSLESDMMDMLSEFSGKIGVLQSDLITLTKEVDNLRKENVFLLNQINELIGQPGDIGIGNMEVV